MLDSGLIMGFQLKTNWQLFLIFPMWDVSHQYNMNMIRWFIRVELMELIDVTRTFVQTTIL